MKKVLFLPFAFLLFTCLSFSQTLAPGAPGKDAQWATAGKQGVGTSATLESKVWFTLAQGVMTEVYYPDVTVANVHLLQFVVVNPKTKKVETEQDDTVHEINVTRHDSLTFQQINKAKSGEWEIRKLYVTNPNNNTVLISTYFLTKNKDLKFYLYFDPSIDNSGMNDTGWTQDGILYVSDKQNVSSLIAKSGFGEKITNGFLGESDGITQLKKTEKVVNYQRAENGNVVQFAEVKTTFKFEGKENKWIDSQYFALGFGKNPVEAKQAAQSSLNEGYVEVWQKYENGWIDYVKTLRKVEPKYQAQFNMAAMILKAHEDKTKRGANIASLTVPWGGGDNANENNIGGYHLIWSRDLYQVATAFWALGDKEAAIRALNFLFKVQQKADGSFPQNSYLDGKPFWGSLQLDEVAFPLIMAHEFGVHDKATYENHVKKAADFIVKTGPSTPQERWEEESGYSPSTIAAEIAGLVCAAEIAKKNGDNESANLYLKTADEWQANIEKWTVTTTGKYSKEPYYVRITQNGKPDAGEKIELNNGAGFFDEREIVDAGFLELVRLGIKSPEDKIIQNSLKVIDEVIRVQTPNGDGFYRYNKDGYGEMDDGRRWNWDGKYTGKGRLWALLSGERGQYELALSNAEHNKINQKIFKISGTSPGLNFDNERKFAESFRVSAKTRLDAMQKFANEGLMIPEQIWDSPNVPKNADKQFVPELKFGEGTGSATPLAWSMAQFIRLAVNLQEGRNLDTPQVVYDRYVLGKKNKILSQQERFPFELQRQIANSKASPKIAGNKAYFYYVGKAKNVMIAGDFTGWKPAMPFEELSEDFFVREIEFDLSVRAEYKIIVDDKWMLDPANPLRIDNGVGGENSYFEMPDYKPTTWDSDKVQPIVKDIHELEIDSKKFGKRTVKIYLPSEYYKRGIPPKIKVLYLQDGSEYITRAKAINVLENLIAAKKVEPFMIVFIDPKDRMKEYWANDDWADFMALEVVPAIEKKYFSVIKTGRENRALLGASLGGITSFWVGLKYPEMFGRIGGQSSSFWVDDERVVKALEKLDFSKTKYKFYIDDGTLEGVEDSHKVVKILRDKGYDITYAEAEVGHNWTAWRDRLADAFVALVN